jgi:hypothetical protein
MSLQAASCWSNADSHILSMQHMTHRYRMTSTFASPDQCVRIQQLARDTDKKTLLQELLLLLPPSFELLLVFLAFFADFLRSKAKSLSIYVAAFA